MVERSGGIGLQLTFVLIALIAAVLYSGKAQFVLNRVNQIIQGKRGCSPIQDIGHVTLHYFGVRGRAEGIRFMLEDNSIPYAETSYTKADWPAVKKKGIETGLFTFGQGKFESGNVAKFTEEYFILWNTIKCRVIKYLRALCCSLLLLAVVRKSTLDQLFEIAVKCGRYLRTLQKNQLVQFMHTCQKVKRTRKIQFLFYSENEDPTNQGEVAGFDYKLPCIRV